MDKIMTYKMGIQFWIETLVPGISQYTNKCHPAPSVPTDEDLIPESVFLAHVGDFPASAPHQRSNPGFCF